MPDSGNKADLASRTASAASIRAKHPDRIPVIVDKRQGDSSLPEIDKKKFLVPNDLTIGRTRRREFLQYTATARARVPRLTIAAQPLPPDT